MTKNFDILFDEIIYKTINEELRTRKLDTRSANPKVNTYLDDFRKEFRDILTSDELSRSLIISDWNLSLADKTKIKKLFKRADNRNIILLTHACPYMTTTRMLQKDINAPQKEIDEKFKKDKKRLINLYSRFGFIQINDNGYMYRPPLKKG